MIKTLSQNMEEQAIPAASREYTFRQVSFAILTGLVGALLNFVPIELAYNISLVLGNFAFIVAAAYLRPMLTFVCAMICVAPLMVSWGHPYGFITFGGEALFIAFLRSRGWYLPTADFLYWLVIGMPLTAMMIWLNTESSNGLLLFSIFKQSINAVFYTAIAVIFIFIFGEKIKRLLTKVQQPTYEKTLNQYLHHILWTVSAFLVVGICLLLSRNLNALQNQQFDEKLNISSQYFSRIVETYVSEHKKAIQQAANQISLQSNHDNKQEVLSQVHEIYPGFITMLMANERGEINAASPAPLLEKVSTDNFNVSDRPYFHQAMATQRMFVSSVFMGRGFGNDPIVAISAPIYHKGNAKPVGIIEGSLNLTLFEHLNKNLAGERPIKVILVDNNEHIIFADESLNLKALQKFDVTQSEYEVKRRMLRLSANDDSKTRFLFRSIELDNGWRVYSVIEHSSLLMIIEQEYLTIFIALFIIFIFVVLLASQVSNTLNEPLKFAIDELAHGDDTGNYRKIPFDAPIEFSALYEELQRGKSRLLKHQHLLEAKVRKRTAALNRANKALKELANTDSLTGLCTRRHMEKRFSEVQSLLLRNDASMMLAILDLDHFKNINDQYGHVFGDECLKHSASVLTKEFDRSSDIVGRYGGEEFIIVAQLDEKEVVIDKLQNIQRAIEAHEFILENGQSIKITVSIGAITAPASLNESFQHWVSLADERLYWVKENGRNQLARKCIDV